MSRIVVDEKLVEQFQKLSEFTEIVSASGEHLGFFCPVDPESTAKALCPYSAEELEGMRLDPANRQGKPLSAVKAALRQRGIAIP
jgi:hypothetical protein